MTTYQFPSGTGLVAAGNNPDSGPLNLGFIVAPLVSGLTATGIRFWANAGAVGKTVTPYLWSAAGVQLATGSAVVLVSGWNDLPYTSTVALTVSTDYIPAVLLAGASINYGAVSAAWPKSSTQFTSTSTSSSLFNYSGTPGLSTSSNGSTAWYCFDLVATDGVTTSLGGSRPSSRIHRERGPRGRFRPATLSLQNPIPQVTYRPGSASRSAYATGTQIDFVKPPVVVVGDYLECIFYLGAAKTITAPDAGWVQVNSAPFPAGAAFGYVAYKWRKIADGTEASTLTFTWTGATDHTGMIRSFVGASRSQPEDVTGTVASGVSASIDATGITPTTPGSLLSWGAMHWNGVSGTETASPGFTLDFIEAARDMIGQDRTLLTPAATGTVSVATSTTPWVVFLDAIRPASSGNPITGSAALSGSGSLSASAAPTVTGAAALAGSGALSVAVVPGVVGIVALTGSGALTAAAKPTANGAAALAGSGSLTAGATPAGAATAALSGSGTLSASIAAVTVATPAALTGTGTLSATVVLALAATADLAGAGVLIAGAAPLLSAAALLVGMGTLTASAAPGAGTVAALSGSGILAASATSAVAASAALAGVGVLTADSATHREDDAALVGTGMLTASATTPGTTSSAALGGTGTLTIVVAPAVPGSAPLSGLGTLSGSTAPATSGSAVLVGVGTLSAGFYAAFTAAAALNGTGQLTAGSAAEFAGGAAFTGTGVLNAVGSSTSVRAAYWDGTVEHSGILWYYDGAAEQLILSVALQ